MDPLDITPVGATTGQADSQEFSTLFKKQYKDAKVVSVGWQGNPDLDKIAELKPDLILMTGEQEDLYEELSEIAKRLLATKSTPMKIGTIMKPLLRWQKSLINVMR